MPPNKMNRVEKISATIVKNAYLCQPRKLAKVLRKLDYEKYRLPQKNGEYVNTCIKTEIFEETAERIKILPLCTCVELFSMFCY